VDGGTGETQFSRWRIAADGTVHYFELSAINEVSTKLRASPALVSPERPRADIQRTSAPMKPRPRMVPHVRRVICNQAVLKQGDHS